MRTRAWFELLALAAGLSIGCGPASALAFQNPSPGSGIPTSLRGYRMTASEPIAEQDGGGQLYRFNGGSAAYVTVFVYPIPEDVKETADSAQWVVVEGEKFAQVLPIQVQRGRYEAFEMAFADPDPLVVGSDTILGFSAAAVTRSKGEVSVQVLCLYLVRGRFVKIRATLPEEGWEEATVPLFARDLAQVMYLHKAH